MTVELEQHNLVESAKIGHNLAASAKSKRGFHRPLMRSQHLAAEKVLSQEPDLSTKTRLEKPPERDILAEAAILFRESHSLTLGFTFIGSNIIFTSFEPYPAGLEAYSDRVVHAHQVVNKAKSGLVLRRRVIDQREE
jgi:hypothetical protein